MSIMYIMNKFIQEHIMILVTTDFISGKELETLQLVKGSVVVSKNVVRDVFAGLKTIIGGELKGYTELLNDARRIATERMMGEAVMMGADAIIEVRFVTSEIMAAAAEVTVYGTAVKFR